MKKVFVLIVLCTGIVLPVFSAVNIFKVQTGLTIPITGDLEDVAETGIILGGQWIHRMSPDLGLGAELSLTSYGDKSEGNSRTEVDMLNLLALSRFALSSSSSKEPYLLAGFGITQTDLDLNGYFGRTSNDDDTAPSLLLGSGVDMPFDKFALGLEARYQHFFFDIGNVDGGGALQLLAQLRW